MTLDLLHFNCNDHLFPLGASFLINWQNPGGKTEPIQMQINPVQSMSRGYMILILGILLTEFP